jgi:endonuclease VIII
VPEGHSVHRIAQQFGRSFVGRAVRASSPQGRFAAGAQVIDGRTMTAARAVGKQLFLEFDGGPWVRIHLGIYGAWDFAGDLAASSPGSKPLASIGAPRRTRVRMAEREVEGCPDAELEAFPLEPVGQVRLRLLTEKAVADLRGPTTCEVLDAAEVERVVQSLGPDPLVGDVAAGEERMLERICARRVPISLLLMDQSVVSGIGNVYRAEILFRARLDPHALGATLPEEVIRGLWRDWCHLLTIGVATGHMLTIDDLDDDAYERALRDPAERHWVYKREGLPCRICGTHIVMELAAARKLYYCPNCQS